MYNMRNIKMFYEDIFIQYLKCVTASNCPSYSTVSDLWLGTMTVCV